MVDRGHGTIVAIVDDDASVRIALLGLMKAAGVRARAFASAEEFLDSGLLPETVCLVADVRMPGMSGLELLEWLNARRAGVPVIFITAHGDAEAHERASRAGAVLFLEKPFDDEVLLEGVRAAMAASPR